MYDTSSRLWMTSPMPRDSSRLRWPDPVERERAIDRLVELAARRGMMQLHSPFYTDSRFIEWIQRELRRRERRRSPGGEVRIAGMAERIRENVLAMRSAVERPDGAAVRRAPEVSATLSAAIGAAATVRCAPVTDLAAAAGSGREIWDERCESWVDLPPEVPDGEYLALKVEGDSMLPLLHPRDLLLVKRGSELARDAIVVARTDDGYVVKRVARVSGGWVELVSLNAAYAPLRIRRDPRAILGRVVMRWCEHAVPAGIRTA